MFDSIIKDVNEKYDLGDKAGALISAILALMTDSAGGGFAGFINRFRTAGLGDLADSWVSSGTNTPISNEQLESALGEDTLRGISEKVGADYETTAGASGYVIPHVVDALTPNGEIPGDDDLLSRAGGFLTGVGTSSGAAVAEVFDRVDPASAGSTANLADNETVTGVPGIFSDEENKSPLSWLLPLLILGLLVILGFWFCGEKSEPVATVNTNVNRANTSANTNANANSTAKTVDSSFKIEAKDGKYTVSGIVPDQATLDKIKASLTAQYGAENIDFSGLKVDASAKAFAADWWTNFEKMLPNLKDWKTGTLSFTGNAIDSAVGLPAAAIDQLKSLFGGWTLPVSIAGVETAAKQANEEALKELQTADSVEEVVKALNVSIINFASGKSDIPADAKTILEKAAEVLKKQSAGASVEIGGHTDSDGNDDANMKLSQARADSVKNALVSLGVSGAMLTSKGYGESKPVAPNDTPDNKFKNRRIEYKTVSGSSPTATTTETKPANTNTTAANANAGK